MWLTPEYPFSPPQKLRPLVHLNNRPSPPPSAHHTASPARRRRSVRVSDFPFTHKLWVRSSSVWVLDHLSCDIPSRSGQSLYKGDFQIVLALPRAAPIPFKWPWEAAASLACLLVCSWCVSFACYLASSPANASLTCFFLCRMRRIPSLLQVRTTPPTASLTHPSPVPTSMSQRRVILRATTPADICKCLSDAVLLPF